MRLSALVVVGLLGMSTAFSQGSEVWNNFQKKFPGEPAAFVERSETLNIIVSGDSLTVWSDLTQDMLHMKDEDILYNRKIYGSSFSQIDQIKAKTLIWDKNRYKEMAVTSFKKNDTHSDGIFYDDSYYYSFDFPSVASQNRTQLQYRENIKDPKFIGGFMMQGYLPQELVTYTIRTSPGVELAYKVNHDKNNLIQFKKWEKGGYVFYQWSAHDMPGRVNEPGAPEMAYYAPHIECYVKSYKTKRGTFNVLRNLDDLHTWYYGFIKGLNQEASPELKAIVADIKAKSANETELVKNTYYWVQSNIKYIAFEQGMRGLIPHPGSYVCEKRYGDCKDMANLIVDMLSLAGVKAYHTWIGTRDIPYKYTELPTPMVDNHMIATYVAPDGKYIFIDGTSSHTPFGFPSSMIQGKEALISFGPDKYEVKTVPIISSSQNLVTDTMKLRIEGRDIVGSGHSSYSGFAKVFSGYDFDKADPDDVKAKVRRYVGKGSNKFSLDKYEIKDLLNNDRRTRVEYEFKLPDYFQTVGDETYVNLSLSKDFFNNYIEPKDRKTPKENDYQFQTIDVTELTIPADMKIDYLPPDAKYTGGPLSYEITYQQSGEKVIYTRKMTVNDLLLMPESFPKWDEAVKSISEAYREALVLKKKN